MITTFFMIGEITIEMCKEFYSWLLDVNYDSSNPEYCNVIINSIGGDLMASFSIIDAIKSSRVPVRTIGTAEIKSAAFMIFISGNKKHRIITKNSVLLCHTYNWETSGKYHELVSAQKEIDMIHTYMVDIISEATGMSEERISQYILTKSDVFISPEEAVLYGLCDRVVESFKL